MVALNHYRINDVYSDGLHCEGNLPVTMFGALFWEELYEYFVPGTFVSLFQNAPLDLFTADFFKNRKKAIEDKINVMKFLDPETFSEIMADKFAKFIHYNSIMSNALFRDEIQFMVNRVVISIIIKSTL